MLKVMQEERVGESTKGGREVHRWLGHGGGKGGDRDGSWFGSGGQEK